jgi:hypothetical protein
MIRVTPDDAVARDNLVTEVIVFDRPASPNFKSNFKLQRSADFNQLNLPVLIELFSRTLCELASIES